jgi:hypothetical protein
LSTFWFAARDSVALLLVIWTAAIAVFVDSDLVGRYLWIPVSLGLTGVIGSILMLAIPATVILAANVALLAVFIISFEALKISRRAALVSLKHRGR